jgi:hypothetical protein
MSASAVTFIERSISGSFVARTHVFTYDQFAKYVFDFGEKVRLFQESLGDAAPDEIDAFAKAALNLDHKSTTLPERPTD